jgi:3-hydroxybutyryl-CoA dehydrogenase
VLLMATATPTTNERRAPAKRPPQIHPAATPGGVIGLGLMGQSIVACLLSAGHPVVAITRRPEREAEVRRHIRGLLAELQRNGLQNGRPPAWLANLVVTSDYAALRDCSFVMESIIEDLATKKDVLRRIEEAVSPKCLIGSNTSAIPVTSFQEGMVHPERVLGIHWAEPAHVQRFIEVICGAQSAPEFADFALRLAALWGKEPTFVRKDVRGFIANRLMYAMMREAFHLVEAGYASIEDVDRSARNDMGWWLTLAGPFRWMDLTGIPAYAAVMRDLFPELSNASEVPALMKQVVESGARGIANAKGFYRYTPEQAKSWEKKFLAFTYDIRKLAMKYADAGVK